MVITSYPRFWLQDPTKLPRPQPGKQRPKLWQRPLFDLAQIQQEIQSGRVDSSDVVFVTEKAKKDRKEHLPWTSTELFQYISCLKPYKFGSTHDFLGAEWCLDSYNNWHSCDAYAMSYDSDRGCRLASGLEVYFKFSVNDQGGLVLVVISLHPSKWSDK